MSIDLPADRPIPDASDLRLLGELINNVSIPLAHAAWNAQMSQAEAALRLVSMAERGLPLRLVADGDRQALWHLAQAGPAAAAPVASPPAAPMPPAPAAAAAPETAAPLPPPEPVPAPAAPMPPAPETDVDTPVTPATEELLAAALPAEPAPVPDAADAPDDDFAAAAASAAAAAGTETPLSGDLSPVGDVIDTPAMPGDTPSAPGDDAASAGDAYTDTSEIDPGPVSPIEHDVAVSAAPTPGVPAPTDPAAWAEQTVTGAFGEQLAVQILELVDPASAQFTAAGLPLPDGQRAVFVRSSVTNTSGVNYPLAGDLNLVLETDAQQLLARAAVAVPGYPPFTVGVAPGQRAEGWSVFIIDAGTRLAGLRWCIQPNMPETIRSWPLRP